MLEAFSFRSAHRSFDLGRSICVNPVKVVGELEGSCGGCHGGRLYMDEAIDINSCGGFDCSSGFGDTVVFLNIRDFRHAGVTIVVETIAIRTSVTFRSIDCVSCPPRKPNRRWKRVDGG